MEKYNKYIELQKEIDALEEQKKLLRADIESTLPDGGYKDETISVIWRSSKKYSYPEGVKSLEIEVEEKIKPIKERFDAEIKPFIESVEVAKRLSEENGTAEVKETKVLAITIK